jgi:hypothetical protein
MFNVAAGRVPDQGTLSHFMCSIDAPNSQKNMRGQLAGIRKRVAAYRRFVGKAPFDPSSPRHRKAFRPKWIESLGDDEAVRAAAESIRLIDDRGIEALEAMVAAADESRASADRVSRLPRTSPSPEASIARRAAKAQHEEGLAKLREAKTRVVAAPLLLQIPKEELEKLRIVADALTPDIADEIKKRLVCINGKK